MSGPKSSRYTLTAEQRRIIMEELRRQQRVLTERSRISQAAKNLRALPSELDVVERNAKLLQSRTGQGTDYINAIVECRTQVENSLKVNDSIPDNASLDQLEQNRIALENAASTTGRTVARLLKEATEISTSLDTNIKSSMDKGFTTSFARIKQHDSQSTILRKDLQAELDKLLGHRDISPAYLEEAHAAATKLSTLTSVVHLTNFRTMVVLPLTRKHEEYLAALENNGKRYSELCAHYDALCQMHGVQATAIPFSETACAQLDEMIKAEETAVLVAEEQTYIRSSIDEVMKEMGYDLLGQRSVVKRSGRKFRNELYAFSEGTAVNVTYASDGSIVMELGGIDDIDRVPSRDETERLCRDMYTFCGEFEEIERRLKARGVILGARLSLLPPNETYAQIINTGDFNMNKAASNIRVKNQHQKKMKTEHIVHE